MSSSYRKTVEQMADQSGNRMACKRCDTPTPVAMLSQYGSRCRRCFEDYCAEPMGGGPGMDTVEQALMRKRLKANRPVGQAMARQGEEDVDTAAREAAKAATARKVAEYERRTRAQA